MILREIQHKLAAIIPIDLQVDNSGPNVTISYESVFTDNRLFGNGGDNIVINLSWDENAVINPAPGLTIQYPSGDVRIDADLYDGNPQTWSYQVTLSDLPENDGILNILDRWY